MKKILLTALLAVSSLVTFAQISSIGIKGGLNLATISSNSYGFGSPGTVKSFNAGLFVDLKFGNFSLQSGLNYTGKGGTYTSTYIFPGFGGIQHSAVKENLYYLQLPVNLVYHIPVIIGNIYFGAGPYIAQGLSGKISSTSNGQTFSQNLSFGNSTNDDIRATQFGADAIVGLKLRGGLLINANYDLGLTNDLPSGESGSSKLRAFGISLGYVFL
jgi:hypothetical protein